MGESKIQKKRQPIPIAFEVEKRRIEENHYRSLFVQKEAFECNMLELQLAINWLFEEAIDDPALLNKIKELSSQIRTLTLDTQCPYEITLGPLL